jgi:hypothetical protein
MLLTFSIFWFTYRYQMLYVSYAKTETNGLIFPKAINQLFTGLYFLELCLIGLYFIQDGPKGGRSCFPQAIIMIITLVFTLIFQVLINRAFGPLFQYLPITFEDEAVERDEAFQRAQATRWQKDHEKDDEHRGLNTELEDKEKQEWRESKLLEQRDELDRRASRGLQGTDSYEMKQISSKRSGQTLGVNNSSPDLNRSRKKWADKSRSRSRSHSHHAKRQSANRQSSYTKQRKNSNPLDKLTHVVRSGLDDVLNEVHRPVRDIESQVLPSANLFDDIDDTLEDIEPEARQKLIKRSFQHPATRAIQPCIWIPHDELGVANDEIRRTARLTDKIWITSVNARLDAAGKVMYRGLPPDRDPFENIEV